MSGDITLKWDRGRFIPALHAGDDFMSYCYETVSERELATRQLKKQFEMANIPVNDIVILGFTTQLLMFRFADDVQGKYVSHSNSHLCLFSGDRVVSIKWDDINVLIA